MNTIQAPKTETTAAIRTTYWAQRGEITEWVGLAAIRAAHPEIDRAEMDAAFYDLALNHRGECDLIPVANLKALTAGDRDAAISLGGENLNAIMFKGSPVAPAARRVYVGRHRGPQGR